MSITFRTNYLFFRAYKYINLDNMIKCDVNSEFFSQINIMRNTHGICKLLNIYFIPGLEST